MIKFIIFLYSPYNFNMKSLNELKLNEEAIIINLEANPNIKRRLMDIGFVKGEKVKLILKNFGDNMRAYKIKNTVIALRKNDTKNIIVKSLYTPS